MVRLLKICMLSLLLLCGNSYAQGNSAIGQEKATACAACHGAKGGSSMPQWPNLAGQGEKYLYQQMLAFKKGKDGERYEPSMSPLMASLNPQDMQDIAAFYAKQNVQNGVADPKLVERGQALYRGGDIQHRITACIACHGPKGLGNREAAFPLLSGQHAEYIVTQLENYKTGKRSTDPNSIMRDIAIRMTKADMQAVASYISGLH